MTDGNCQILVAEHAPERGRLVLEIECQRLGGSRDLYDGLLTIEGCTEH